MRHSRSLALLIVLAAAAGCDVAGNGDVTATEKGANTINGSIHVPAGLHSSGALGTVNGSIDIDDNAVVGAASTVNGAIELGAHATAGSLTTVNGGVTMQADSRVTKSVTTVNGTMNMHSGAEVGGKLENVNGHIVLTAAHVAGGLKTVGGDIDISGASHVEGGIHVEKAGGWFNMDNRKPRIVIGPGAVVQGELRFDREVRLYVSDQASIGPVTGATAARFSGDRPPG